MLFFRKGFTLLEIIIVLALTGLFIAATSYLNRDTRTYQANAERLANYIDSSIRNAKSSMTLGRGVMSGSTLVATDKRTISIRGTGITTTYGTTNTGTESSLTWPFYDSDTAYQITDISVSSGILMNGQMPIWDQTGVTMADITVLPNGDFQVFSSSVATPIRILRITAGYAGFERSVMIDTVMGRTTSVQGRGEVDYIPAPPAPPPNSCAATPSFANIGTTNIGTPTTAGQGWYYSATPGNCSYDCINGFKGASCLTPPTPTCDTNPSFPNLGTLSTGSPSSVGQAWYYSATPGNCTYTCNNGYTGNNCLTAPVNGCAANPTYPNIGTITVGSPTTWNQAWTYNPTPGTCTYDCTGGYSGPSCATAPFVTNFKTTWKVGTAGYGNGNNIVQFSIVRIAGSVIDWGDGIIEPLSSDNPSHTYLVPGDYTITMSNITRFFNNSGNNNSFGKLTAVNDWGGVAWTSMSWMFGHADNLNQLPLGAPNMTYVSNTSFMFHNTAIFNQSIANFNTSNVTDMYGMFSKMANFNQSIANFNTSNVTNMGSMFQESPLFNQSVANFDTSNVTSMYGMFMGATAFNQPVSNFDTTKVTNMYGMFMGATAFNQSVANFNTSNVTSMGGMFDSSLSFNQPVSNFDTTKVTNMYGMFANASAFNQSVANFNTSNVTNMGLMFFNAQLFNQSVANFNTSNVTNMGWMFANASAFNQSVANFNTSNVTNMGLMFANAQLFNQSVSNFDTAKVTDMSQMFGGTLFNQSVSNFNTSNVTNMGGMFDSTPFNQSVANFDTSKVTNMSLMFSHSTSFNQSLANFDTANVLNMQAMFEGATAFNQPLSHFNTAKVLTMWSQFNGAMSFNQDISNWCVSLLGSKPFSFDTSSNAGFINNSAKQPQWGTCPSAVAGAFTTTWKVGTAGYGNGDNTVSFSLTRVAGTQIDWGDGIVESISTDNVSHTYATAGDKTIKINNITRFGNDGWSNNFGKLTAVTDWGGIVWTSMKQMFTFANNLNSFPVSGLNTSNVTDMSYMFYGASIFNQSVSNFDTSNVTNMAGMFLDATIFNQSVSNFDTSKVVSMNNMFHMSSFNQSVSNFDTSNVLSMLYMFGQTPFNQSVANFNTSKVTNMSGMFGGCHNFNQSVSNFDTSKVVDMSYMFIDAWIFNQSVSNFDTSKVTNMYGMFQNAKKFNQSVSNFNTSNVTDMSGMFSNTDLFNQSVANFNTSKVTTMYNMFGYALAFNQDISHFDTSKVNDMSRMFNFATAFNQDISNWCVTLISTKPGVFDNASNAGFINNSTKQPQWGTCPVAPVVGFTTTWKVGTLGYGNGDNTVRFKVARSTGSMIDWGDGTIESLSTDSPLHTFAVAGDYTIKMNNITRFYIYSTENSNQYNATTTAYAGKLTAVTDWGNMAWTSMDGMFSNADHLNQLPAIAPNMTGVTGMNSMFMHAKIFNQSVANFDTSNVIDMSSTFYGADSFNQPILNFNTSKVISMSAMLGGASFNQSVANFDTSKVVNMSYMFNGAISFNQSVANFDTSNVTDMRGMFAGSAFNQSVANFNTSKVINMGIMFAGSAFNQSVANFNTSKVTTMDNMFAGSAFNQSVANFDTSKVTNMSSMFANTSAFNQSVANFDTSKVTTMDNMFAGSAFNQSVANFDTSQVINMNRMFSFGSAFNQSLATFNTSNVTDMEAMFANNVVFNQSLATFNTSNVANMQGMFQSATAFNQNLSTWIVNPNVISCNSFNINTSAWILAKPAFSNCTP